MTYEQQHPARRGGKSVFDKAKRIVDITPSLRAPMPAYKILADGLTVTEERATAWFRIKPSSTQMATAKEMDAELAQAIALAQKVLRDRTCHIKIVWGRITGAEYATSAAAFTAPEGRAWTTVRTQAIDAWQLPERHVFLGIDIEDRHDPKFLRAINRAVDWVRGDLTSIPRQELAWLDQTMRALGGQLNKAPWYGAPVDVETLAWMLGRECFRASDAAPIEGTVSGAHLARLMRGRMVPYRDHQRFYDAAGQASAYSAQLIISQFSADALDTNDTGQWLTLLSGISRPALDGSATVDVHAEASIRFEFMSQKAARKVVKRTKDSAAEQRREAAKSDAGEPSADVQYSEAEMAVLEGDINRGRVRLVKFWPTLSVSEDNLDDLRASVEAVIEAYSQVGITVEVAADEQAEAWMSTLPGDHVRVEAMHHISDAEAFFGSWFWAGSVVGDEDGSAIGYTTGTTAQIVRCHPTQAPLRGDTSTIAVLGRSGRGKTTLLQLLALDAAAERSWVPVFDLKGDLNNSEGGLVGAAHSMGLEARRVDMSATYAGTCDLLATMDADDALIHAHSQLMLLVSDALRLAAHPVLMRHIAALIGDGEERSTAILIERMRQDEDETARRVAAELGAFQGDAIGRMIVGARQVGTLEARPGIVLLQFPKLDLPPAGTPASEWTVMQRVSAAVVRGALSWVTTSAKDPALRPLRKLVVVPEAHLFTATQEGAAFLDQTARLGRALGASLAIDSQDPTSIAERDGIMEQIVTVFAFSQKTRKQQDAVAEILGLAPSDQVRAILSSINTNPAGGVWHGHCIMRDARDRVATIQVAIPNRAVARALDTTPRRTP